MNYEEIMSRYGKSSNFVVYSASAGTGKTHTITKEELKHIFEKGSSDLIAVTFTNAAAKEMKERIIEYLIEIAAAKDIQRLKKDVLYNDILEELKSVLNTKDTMFTEGILLKILNNYSSLTISTIDSMAARLLRAYQDKTNLPININILLDGNEFYYKLITESIYRDTHFLSLSEDEQIKYIKDIIKDTSVRDKKINTDVIENIIDGVINIESSLFITNNSIELEENLDNAFLKENIKNLKETINEINPFMSMIGPYPKNHLSKIKEALDNSEKHLNNIEAKSYTDKHLFNDVKSQEQREEIRGLYEEITKHLVNIQILNNIQTHSQHIRLYNNFIRYYNTIKYLLPDIPLKKIYSELSKVMQIKEEIPVRFGRNISMILVDEFQDTSPEQFKVLGCLFDYLLDSKCKSIVVGDTKQAIYLFRGGDYKMLSYLIDKKGKNINTLNKNFRSRKEIVRFVGNLFPTKDSIENVSKTLDFNDKKDEENIKAYNNAFIKTGAYDLNKMESANEGGYVEIVSYGIDYKEIHNKGKNDDSFSSFELTNIFNDIKERINNIKERGYTYKDICIITSKNDNVKIIASELIKSNIPIKSYTSLDARERSISKEIVSILKYSIDRKNRISLYQWLHGSLLSGKITELKLEKEYEYLISDFLNNPSQFTFDKNSEIYKKCFEEILNKSGFLSAYDMLTLIYRIYNISSSKYQDEQAAYMTLLDAAINIERSKDNSIRTFIEEFETKDTSEEYQTPELWTMNVSESKEAITVSTIHKMKGLGFPVVFYLVKRGDFGNKIKYRSEIIKIDGKYYLIRPKKDYGSVLDMSSLNIENKEELKKNLNELFIDYAADKINCHYVALTRAQDELYVFLFNQISSNSGKSGTKCILTSMIYNFYLNTVKDWEIKDNNRYVYNLKIGTPQKIVKKTVKAKKEFVISEFAIPEQKPIYLRSFLNRDEQARIGTVIHNILSKIEFIKKETIDETINRAISETEREGIVIPDRINIITNLKSWFENKEMGWIFEEKEDREIKNEMEFVDYEGNLLRADRVIVDRDRVFVIDYKTGRPNETEKMEYKTQVKRYTKTLSDLFNRPAEGFLFYIDENKVQKI